MQHSFQAMVNHEYIGPGPDGVDGGGQFGIQFGSTQIPRWSPAGLAHELTGEFETQPENFKDTWTESLDQCLQIIRVTVARYKAVLVRAMAYVGSESDDPSFKAWQAANAGIDFSADTPSSDPSITGTVQSFAELAASATDNYLNGFVPGGSTIPPNPNAFKQSLEVAATAAVTPVLPPGFSEDALTIGAIIAQKRVAYGNWYAGILALPYPDNCTPEYHDWYVETHPGVIVPARPVAIPATDSFKSGDAESGSTTEVAATTTASAKKAKVK